MKSIRNRDNQRQMKPWLLACTVLLALLFLCSCASRKQLAPSLCESLLKTVQSQRISLDDDDAFALCEDIAKGTVVSVTVLTGDYLPVYVNLSNTGFFYRAVPIEQWSATHAVVTVTVEDVISGTRFQTGTTASFNIPMDFQELSIWNESDPKYTGRKFSLVAENESLPLVGDEVTMLLGGGQSGFYRLTGDDLSFVFSGKSRLHIGWLRPGVVDNGGAYWADSESEPRWRRNVIQPRQKDVSILEAAFLTPMKEREKLSSANANAKSSFVVKGVVKSVSPLKAPIEIWYQNSFSEKPLEAWSLDGWMVTVTVNTIDKAMDQSLSVGAELVLCVPRQLVNTEGQKTISLKGRVPVEGSEVTAYWNEGYDNVAVDWLLRTSKGDWNILYGYVNRNPSATIMD